MMKEARASHNAILDRSIYEDAMFMKMNTDMGNATAIEYEIYQELLANMLAELEQVSQEEASDLTVFIKVSYETMIKRIEKRGREYEQISSDPSLVDYYQRLLKYYAKWEQDFKGSPLLIIDGDKYDFVENQSDRNYVLNLIETKLVELGQLSESEFARLKAARA